MSSKQKRERAITKKSTKYGGPLEGPSHELGGIPIEVEGGEIIVNINHNGAAKKHEKGLLALNKNPDKYKIVKNTTKDARKRKQTIQ